MTSIRLLTMALPRLGLTPDRDTDWRVGASCATYDLTEHDPWHPTEGTQSADPAVREAAYAEARAICTGCPVRDQCLTQALERGGEEGMRGGLTPDEQRAAIRAAGRKPRRRIEPGTKSPIKHGTPYGYRQHTLFDIPYCDECRAARRVEQGKYAARKKGRAS